MVFRDFEVVDAHRVQLPSREIFLVVVRVSESATPALHHIASNTLIHRRNLC